MPMPSACCGSSVTELLVLCTGNAARSVMAGFMFEYLCDESRYDGPPVHVVSAGTHTIDGQPMGIRNRNALSGLPEMAGAVYTKHRSRQVHQADLARADLVVGMEADHVRFTRRQFPDAAARTATIRRLCTDLPPAPPSLSDRVAALQLADLPVDNAEDVIDPAGRDQHFYDECVAELWGLCQQLVTLL
jgi:protein-tyrosine-phosphatase